MNYPLKCLLIAMLALAVIAGPNVLSAEASESTGPGLLIIAHGCADVGMEQAGA